MYKKSYSLQLSYEITAPEKAQAEKALLSFENTLKALRKANDHLNILYTPYKDHPEISDDEIKNFRAALRRFRDKVIDNFNNFKIAGFYCVALMQPFSSDTQSSKLIKSFISSVEKIETYVNELSELFSNLEDKEFVLDVVKCIEEIKNEVDQLEQIIDDRIKKHIQSNILGKTWMDSVKDELDIDIEEKVPLLIELNRARRKELNQFVEKNQK